MLKSSRYLNTIMVLLIMIAAFCEIPYINSYLTIGTGVLLLVIYNIQKRKQVISYITTHLAKVGSIRGVDIYSIDYETMRTHNAALIQGKVNCILMEDELRQELDENEQNAVLYHEIGHLHTISSQKIFFLQCSGLLFSAMGLHSILYGKTQHLVVITGIVIILLIEWLKRYVEYEADKYAIFHGCEKKNLESAIRKIENMNASQNIITVTGHPKLKARMKRLDKC